MTRFFPKILLLLLVPVLLASCGKEVTLEDKIGKQWDYPGDTVGSTDGYLTLINGTSSRRFYQTLSAKADTTQGDWFIKDSTIVLVYDKVAFNTAVDSVVYNVKENDPSVIFMNDGQELSRMNDGQLMAVKDTVKHQLLSISDNEMTISNANGEVTMTYTPTKIESKMSVTGVLRGLLGMIVLVFLAWLASSNRKAIDWGLVGKGLLFQIIFAVLILKVPFVAAGFEAVSQGFLTIINFANEGAEFLFGSFITGQVESPLVNFVFTILPTIVFFSALTSMLYYFGILQKVVWVLAWAMKRVMKLSGAEALAAAGNIFLGQTEAPLLIRPYLKTMTKSEMMCLMAGGMATIAGGVLAAYISFLGGDDPAQQLFFAKHLLAASVMSAPAAIVAAKILVPETEEIQSDLKIPKDKIGANVLEAIANGTTDGLKLAVNVAAMLLVFIGLMALLNWIMHDGVGSWTGINDYLATVGHEGGLTFDLILGYVCAPLAWCMGVPTDDIFLVGQLLGQKTILNEFVAYKTLGDMKALGSFTYEKSIVMATYVLCGFANFASIGIQIGGIGSLVPERKSLLSKLGVRALIGGTLACLFTAVIVGMLM